MPRAFIHTREKSVPFEPLLATCFHSTHAISLPLSRPHSLFLSLCVCDCVGMRFIPFRISIVCFCCLNLYSALFNTFCICILRTITHLGCVCALASGKMLRLFCREFGDCKCISRWSSMCIWLTGVTITKQCCRAMPIIIAHSDTIAHTKLWIIVIQRYDIVSHSHNCIYMCVAFHCNRRSITKSWSYFVVSWMDFTNEKHFWEFYAFSIHLQ